MMSWETIKSQTAGPMELIFLEQNQSKLEVQLVFAFSRYSFVLLCRLKPVPECPSGGVADDGTVVEEERSSCSDNAFGEEVLEESWVLRGEGERVQPAVTLLNHVTPQLSKRKRI
jgi:hypothetical protein